MYLPMYVYIGNYMCLFYKHNMWGEDHQNLIQLNSITDHNLLTSAHELTGKLLVKSSMIVCSRWHKFTLQTACHDFYIRTLRMYTYEPLARFVKFHRSFTKFSYICYKCSASLLHTSIIEGSLFPDCQIVPSYIPFLNQMFCSVYR